MTISSSRIISSYYKTDYLGKHLFCQFLRSDNEKFVFTTETAVLLSERP